MATVHEAEQPAEVVVDKGLKVGALGLISTIVMGVASTAPAYSLAATLGFIALVGGIGFHAPLIALAAFIPMLLCSIAYSEMNKSDPDCGTTFTWAARAFGPRTGWAGGWGIVAADILVMASLAQVAGQYVFFLVQGPTSKIGHDPASGWVLLVGVLWIIAMTIICYIGIEVSANFQKILLGVEIVMLIVLSVTALAKVFGSNHPASSVRPQVNWFLPTDLPLSAFVSGLILMLFIYWGWDTAVAVNEETKDKAKTPGRAAIISTVILLFTYVLIILAAQSYSGLGTRGIGLRNAGNSSDVLSVLGGSVFGATGFGAVLSRLLFLMILSSAAASTQTTILPTARTTLSMATYKALPAAFARISPRFLTPTVSTIAMGIVSIILYIPLNFISGGNAIADAVTAIGLYIAFYYGLTAFSCVWYYRKTILKSRRNLFMQGIFPLLGGLIMYTAGGIALQSDWVAFNSYTTWLIPGVNWRVGGIFIIAFAAALAGLIWGIYQRFVMPAYFRKETLTRATPTLVPDVE
jgi:amino acid transporter